MQEKKRKNKTSNTYCDANECSFYHYYESVFSLHFIVFISMKNSVGKNFAVMIFIYGGSMTANAECRRKFRGLF